MRRFLSEQGDGETGGRGPPVALFAVGANPGKVYDAGPVGQSCAGQTRAGKTARSCSTARLRALLSGSGCWRVVPRTSYCAP